MGLFIVKGLIAMKISKKDLKDVVRNIVMEMELSESDIIAKEKSEWKEMKKGFSETVKGLIKNIEDDNYSDANGDIEKAVRVLKAWKKRIAKNLSDSASL